MIKRISFSIIKFQCCRRLYIGSKNNLLVLKIEFINLDSRKTNYLDESTSRREREGGRDESTGHKLISSKYISLCQIDLILNKKKSEDQKSLKQCLMSQILYYNII